LSPTYSICREHGYLAGEQKVCPICGKSTEVYSRITGYYRPVSNWNAGKAQEFKDRKTYNTGDKILPRHAVIPEPVKETEAAEMGSMDDGAFEMYSDMADAEAAGNSGKGKDNTEGKKEIIILTTSECPKCKMAKASMDKKGIAYRTVTDQDDEGRALAIENGIMSAPALFITENGKTEVVRDFNQILNTIKAM
jgi:ribonucleoside-triphosphate reductase